MVDDVVVLGDVVVVDVVSDVVVVDVVGEVVLVEVVSDVVVVEVVGEVLVVLVVSDVVAVLVVPAVEVVVETLVGSTVSHARPNPIARQQRATRRLNGSLGSWTPGLRTAGGTTRARPLRATRPDPRKARAAGRC